MKSVQLPLLEFLAALNVRRMPPEERIALFKEITPALNKSLSMFLFGVLQGKGVAGFDECLAWEDAPQRTLLLSHQMFPFPFDASVPQ
jgi:hypothetical protein